MKNETGISSIRSATAWATRSAPSLDAAARVQQLQSLIEQQNTLLMETHPYFVRCRAKQIDREQALGLVKHLYCFSVFFERLLARRVTEHSSIKDPRVLALARRHLREELGHVELFRQCLEANGVPPAEILALTPATFTKAMFGYLTVTIQYESEYVTNVAMVQVMESIGYHFFSATLEMLGSHGIASRAISDHAEEDIGHANLGVELIGLLDDSALKDCHRIVLDIYRLMSFVFAEWLGADTDVFSRSSKQLAAG